MDMILAGDDHYGYVLTQGVARIQLSVWSIMAAPLIMSNDLRTVTQEYRDILLNKEIIAVDQDVLGKAGKLIYSNDTDQTQIWARNVAGGVVVALVNMNNDSFDKININNSL